MRRVPVQVPSPADRLFLERILLIISLEVGMIKYLYETDKPGRVMHLAKVALFGEILFEAYCEINHDFNRTINVPLGRRTCKNCVKRINKILEKNFT